MSLLSSKKSKKKKLFGASRIRSQLPRMQSSPKFQFADTILTPHVTPEFFRFREEQSKHFPCNTKMKKEARKGTGKVIWPGQAIVDESKDFKDQKPGICSRQEGKDQIPVKKNLSIQDRNSSLSALEKSSAPRVLMSGLVRTMDTERRKRNSEATIGIVRPVGRLCTLGAPSPTCPLYDTAISPQEEYYFKNGLDPSTQEQPYKRRYTDRLSLSRHIGSAAQPIQLDVDSDTNVGKADSNLSMYGEERFELQGAIIWLDAIKLQVTISFHDTSMVFRKIKSSLKSIQVPKLLNVAYDKIERIVLNETNIPSKQVIVWLKSISKCWVEMVNSADLLIVLYAFRAFSVHEIRIVLCCEASKKSVTAILTEKCALKFENNEKYSDEFHAEDIRNGDPRDATENRRNWCDLCKDQGMDEIILKFPLPPSKFDVITIRRGDMERLEPECYLNDIIIDYYFRRLLHVPYAADATYQKTVLFLSTHFYAMLRAKASSKPSKEKYSGYENVRTWNNLNKLFKSSLVFVPIHEELHWSLAIIVNPIMAALETNDEGLQTWIILLDPLEGYHKKSLILENLKRQWEQSGASDTIYRNDRVKSVQLNFPSQNNSYDCGVYVIKYAEVILQNMAHLWKESYEDSSDSFIISKSQLKKLICADAFSAKNVDEMRIQIREALSRDTTSYRRLLASR
uniref:Sentrin/sumospecific protease putative n=1 Tax=Albugo laibachii Nc14 TaxID=890382 RepID=F0W856_9STRA|nr:sentrin/sumospecific protease putative [Albugo laibachii Nc14]|eukprot:CCA17340.1 sentrin/sumospecific protease putative [Albugo laibachii Nc14]